MKEFYFIIAWRNLWRNKKRSALAVSSIAFAVLFTCIMLSAQEGSYERMIDNLAGIYSGYIRVSSAGYTESPSFDKMMNFNSDRLDIYSSVPHVSGIFPRIESAVLVSYQERSKGVLLLGIDPEIENKNNRMSGSLVSGEYFNHNSQSILLGSGVASYLKVTVGDSIVVFGQDRYGSMAANIFPVSGIIKLASPYINDRLIYLPLKATQQLFESENKVTTVAIMLDRPNSLNETKTALQNLISSDLELKTWNDLFPEMEQAILLDRTFGIVMVIILYAIIALGILGTIIMMTLERTKEFAMSIAVGMKRFQLGIISVYESMMICLLGVLLGVLLAFPVVSYLHFNPIRFTGKYATAYSKFNIEPIMPFSLDSSIFINQGIIVFIIAILVSQYPLLRIYRMNILNSLRG